MEEAQITYIGKVDHRNKLTKFGIKGKDRTKHMYVIGKTGTGKTTFMENMIAQDIANGNGFAFIDPHGESVAKLLDYIPEWRVNDVIYLNPADIDFPVAFNPLEDVGPDKRHLVADGLMSVFEKIWPEAFSGRMTYILNNTMLALLESPDSNLLGINRMLTDKDYRKRIVANVTDPAVKNAWEELMKWDDKTWRDAIAALVNKVGQFTTNPIVRNIIGQTKSTFDFRRAMDERKIILINLSKGMIGEQNAPLIGAMLITKIYLAAMSRAELPYNVLLKVPPFYFYVDEFQNFANDSFASILSEARKYKLALTVANQYIAQMEETIRDAVFGNMGTTVSFRVGPLDAEFIEKVFAPVFTQEDLQNVMFGQYYVSLQIDGMGSKPFSAQGLPPIPPLQTSLRNMVIEASRKQFARPKIEVDAAVKEWFGYHRPADAMAPKTDDRRIIRPDVGNQAPQPPKKFDPKSYDAPAQKPLPPVTGYKKPDDAKPRSAPAPFAVPKPAVQSAPVVPKPTVQSPAIVEKPVMQSALLSKPVPQSVPVAPKQIPVAVPPKKDSAELAELLGKLDAAVVAETPSTRGRFPSKSEIDPSKASVGDMRSLTEGVSSKQQNTTHPQPPLVEGAATSKPLSRAATPEKKSALAEALAKAMGEPKPQEQKLENNTTPTPSQNKSVDVTPPNPTSPSTSRDAVGGDSVLAPTPSKRVSEYRSATPKEVPEDILRQILE